MAAVMTYSGLISDIQVYLERPDDTDLLAQIPNFVLFAQRRISRELDILGLQQYVSGSFTAAQGVVVKPNRWLSTISINYGSTLNTITGATLTLAGSGYSFAPAVSFSGGGGTGATATAYVNAGVVTQIAITNPGSGYTSTPTVTVGGPDVTTGTTATAVATRGTANIKRNFLLPRAYEYCRSYWPDPTQTGNPRFYADYDFNHWLIVPTPSASFPVEIAYYELSTLLDDSAQTNWLTENAPDLLLYACLLEATPFVMADDRIEVWQGMYERAAKGYQAENKGRITDRTQTRTK